MEEQVWGCCDRMEVVASTVFFFSSSSFFLVLPSVPLLLSGEVVLVYRGAASECMYCGRIFFSIQVV